MESYPTPNGAATAPALEMFPAREPRLEQTIQQVPQPERVSYQPSLFRDAAGGPKVIPIPTLAPMRPQEREPAGPRKASRTNSTPRQRRSSESPLSQQTLDFHQANASPGLQVEAVIYCDSPVALPSHRIIAAAVDLSMITAAMGIFLAIFFVCGGVMAFSKVNAPFFGGAAILLTLFYRALFCLGNGDTPGMRFAGLRLVDFDGRRPSRDQRGLRQIASLLSFLSAGLGLVWALVDEESLTWHDHISKTFPTVG